MQNTICSNIERYECDALINQGLTSQTHVVHVPLLERIWLVPFSLLLLWAVIGIVSLLVALETQHLANVLHRIVIVVVLAIVASMV